MYQETKLKNSIKQRANNKILMNTQREEKYKKDQLILSSKIVQNYYKGILVQCRESKDQR